MAFDANRGRFVKFHKYERSSVDQRIVAMRVQQHF